MTVSNDLVSRASVLIEALPYIRSWSGKTVVVKIGGEILDDDENLNAFAIDITLMRFVGMCPIVVHGGGRQITHTMQRLGKEPSFVEGHRVTDEETIGIVGMVLLGQVNKHIVSAINRHGGRAAGISGEDGELLTARRIGGPLGEDLGFVGEVAKVNPAIIESLIEGEFIPVIAPLGTDAYGMLNINADLATGALAAALFAEKVIFLTNVAGLYRDSSDETSLISEVSVQGLEGLIDEGIMSKGMIPKMSSVVTAMQAGVPRAHILDGRVPHALLLELFTDKGFGTMVTQ